MENQPKYIIRHALVEDVQKILDIHNYSIINSAGLYIYEPLDIEQKLKWFEEKKVNNFPILVAVSNEEVCGFTTYDYFRHSQAYKYTALIDIAIAQNYHTMIAVIDGDNDVSVGLHSKFGFNEVGHVREVGFKFGTWRDIKILQRTFYTPEHPVDG
eukprot:gene15103-20321_t